MCGIFGSPNITPEVLRMLPYIAGRMEDRGTQAWGASNGREIVKHLGPITASWGEEIERFSTWTSGIFHTRLASQGSSTILDNAHPFRSVSVDGIEYTGIHNGCLANHTELNTKYSRSCTVDSEHLWKHRAEGLPWTDLRGYANLAWYEFNPQDESTEPEMYLARINSSFLDVIRTGDGGLVFASTKSPLVQAAGLVGAKVAGSFFLLEGKVYHASREGLLWDTEEKVDFAGSYSVSSAVAARGGSGDDGNFTRRHVGTGGTGSGTNSTYNGRCAKCSNEKAERRFLLCEKCFNDFSETYIRVYMKSEAGAKSKPMIVIIQEEAARQLLLSGVSPGTHLSEDELQEIEEFAYANAR